MLINKVRSRRSSYLVGTSRRRKVKTSSFHSPRSLRCNHTYSYEVEHHQPVSILETKQFRRWHDTVPSPPEGSDSFLHQHAHTLTEFLRQHKRVVVLTGAGISTESSLPDYRSPNGAYSKGHKPITYQEFARSHATRQRYWARSYLGREIFASATPNIGHYALAELERMNSVYHIITQNVDGLHQKAGSKKVLELHGSLSTVICTGCNRIIDREMFQQELIELNPEWYSKLEEKLQENASKGPAARPDGDITLSEGTDYTTFNLPDCSHCGGFLKPNVVLFGETIPRHVVEKSYELVDLSDGVLALGTSLQVFSVYRLVNRAHESGKPVGIINIGPTRGDSFGLFKFEHRLGDILPLVVQELKRTE